MILAFSDQIETTVIVPVIPASSQRLRLRWPRRSPRFDEERTQVTCHWQQKTYTVSASNVPYLIIAPFLLVILLITRNLNYSTSGFHGAAMTGFRNMGHKFPCVQSCVNFRVLAGFWWVLGLR